VLAAPPGAPWDRACASLAGGLLLGAGGEACGAWEGEVASGYVAALPDRQDLAALPLGMDPARASAWVGGHAAFARGISALDAAFRRECDPAQVPPAELRRLAAAVYARAFRLGTGTVALLPVVDLANHRGAGPSCAWREDPGDPRGVQLVARRALAPGAPLDISYGTHGRSSLDVFLQFGFCPTDLPDERVELFAGARDCHAWARAPARACARTSAGECERESEREGEHEGKHAAVPLHVYLARGRPRGRLRLELTLARALRDAGLDPETAVRSRLEELAADADAVLAGASGEDRAPRLAQDQALELAQRRACLEWLAQHARVVREALDATCMPPAPGPRPP